MKKSTCHRGGKAFWKRFIGIPPETRQSPIFHIRPLDNEPSKLSAVSADIHAAKVFIIAFYLHTTAVVYINTVLHTTKNSLHNFTAYLGGLTYRGSYTGLV